MGWARRDGHCCHGALISGRCGLSSLRDPRCWREVLIRGGITTLMAGVIYFVLVPEPLIWLAPVVVSGLVVLRWVLRPETWDDQP